MKVNIGGSSITPALTVGGTVVLMGRVPAENDLRDLLLKAIEKAATNS